MIQRVHVPSLTDAGRRYLVAAHGGVYTCECPRAGFTRSGGAPCKHVAVVVRADALISRCYQSHAGFGDGNICYRCLVELLALMAGKVRREFIPKAESKAKVAAARKKKKRKRKPKASAEG